MAAVRVDSIEVARTKVISDSFEPEWLEHFDLTITDTTEVAIDLIDIDASGEELIEEKPLLNLIQEVHLGNETALIGGLVRQFSYSVMAR